jgi:hypothetical protein
MDSKGWKHVVKADKTDPSTDKDTDAPEDKTSDIIDAEIVDETTPDEVETTDEVVIEEPEAITEESEETEGDTLEETAEEVADAADDAEPSAEAEDAAAETPPAIEPEPEAAAPEAKKSGGFLPVFLGGVVAAGLGFGLSQVVGPLTTQENEEIAKLERLIAAQSEQISQLKDQQAQAVEATAAAGDAASAAATAVEGLTASVAAVNGRIDDAAGALAKLDGRITVIEKQPITQSLPSSAIEAYERELEELKETVANQRAEAAAMEENAKMTAQEALARAALTRILSALDSGAPYRAALTDFSAAAGISSPSELEALADSGVPTLISLQDGFPDMARAALAASRRDQTEEDNRLTSFLKAQLGARSVTPQDGDDADAILSRAEDALRSGRLPDVLAELVTLPDAAQAEMADWVALAEQRQAAEAAADQLSQQLNSN